MRKRAYPCISGSPGQGAILQQLITANRRTTITGPGTRGESVTKDELIEQVWAGSIGSRNSLSRPNSVVSGLGRFNLFSSLEVDWSRRESEGCFLQRIWPAIAESRTSLLIMPSSQTTLLHRTTPRSWSEAGFHPSSLEYRFSSRLL